MKVKKLRGSRIVSRESKLTLFDFVYNDRFELESYLSYLFYRFNDNVPDPTEYPRR
jgi:hypothetical protein